MQPSTHDVGHQAHGTPPARLTLLHCGSLSAVRSHRPKTPAAGHTNAGCVMSCICQSHLYLQALWLLPLSSATVFRQCLLSMSSATRVQWCGCTDALSTLATAHVPRMLLDTRPPLAHTSSLYLISGGGLSWQTLHWWAAACMSAAGQPWQDSGGTSRREPKPGGMHALKRCCGTYCTSANSQ
jgi:hypothetical protein